ncbi:MAG TPA: DUF1361 domain-containing protein [Puia sp.]|nr:DUF1361 domain-containing protein [Puia sp.]
MNKHLSSDNAVTPRIPAPVAGRWRILSSEMDRLLCLSMLFSCLLTVARVVHTEHRHFLFLIWNLFLAYIPYFISTRLAHMEEVRAERAGMEARRGLGWWTLALLWLLFIPNTFYIITDLYHLGDLYNDRTMPQWFDLAMILSFVWNGLLLGVLSVRQMERLFLPRLTLMRELLFLYPVMWLNALGIYIGRYLRYNSWDIVTDPFRLLRDIAAMVVHPLRHQNTWDMVLCFSILMTLIYLLMKRISKALT